MEYVHFGSTRVSKVVHFGSHLQGWSKCKLAGQAEIRFICRRRKCASAQPPAEIITFRRKSPEETDRIAAEHVHFATNWDMSSERKSLIPNTRRWNRAIC